MPTDPGFNTASAILLTAVIVALIAVLPRWPYSRGWSYRPTAVISALLVIVIFLLATGVW